MSGRATRRSLSATEKRLSSTAARRKRAQLGSYLRNTLHVSKVDFVIGTHPHADHIGGLPDVIRACKVKKLYSPVDEFEAKPFETMKRAADDKKLKITVPQAGQSFSLGRAKVEFLAPLGIYDNVNDLSLVVRITYGQTAFLFTGDAERPSEYDMTDSGEDLSATVLKVGHHGSNTSTLLCFSAAGYAGLRHHQLRKGQCLRPSA